MITLDPRYKAILLEALEDKMYNISLKLNKMKGQPLSKQRKELSKKQAEIEKLQHLISISD